MALMTQEPRPVLPILAAAATVVLWASAFVAIRGAGRDFSPGALGLGRQLAGLATLTVFVLIRAAQQGKLSNWPTRPVLLGTLAWGAAWFGGYSLALNATGRRLDAGTTSLLVNLAPVLIAVLAVVLLGEVFRPRLLAGMAVAFAGVLVIALAAADRRPGQPGDLLGVLLALAACVLYALSATGQKPLLKTLDPLTMTWIGCATGTLVCLPFAPALMRESAVAPASAIFGMIWLGVFATAVAFVLWGYALARTSVGQLAASTYAVPPIVVLMSWALLGEVPGLLTLGGGVLCLAGIALGTLKPRSAVSGRPRSAPAHPGEPTANPPGPAASPPRRQPSRS